ncbi:MAG: hypothetical protein JSS86_07390 [Cyanobacteria bacterium SZAS LIN-2]|nr:hypothetical protein [Cyanobacteria bacterium SZAS LIN-3]MBS1996116.1 hypothetical protein [Cyanobacteria bacterium SZAS LIN-2]
MITYMEGALRSYNLLVKRLDNKGPITTEKDSFWVAANTFNAILDYWVASKTAPDTDISKNFVNYFHQTVPTNSSRAQLQALAQKGLDGVEGGMWLDDYGWWANSFLTALENADQLGLSGDDIDTLTRDSINCWNLMTFGWDPSASPLPGGVWNCKKQDWALTGRNNVTNLQFWLMSVRLAAYTKNNDYLNPNMDILKWFEDGFTQNRLFDGDLRLVRERMVGFLHEDESTGFYWAGDQGLFIGCMLADKRLQNGSSFQSLRDAVANTVATKMVDTVQVLHDHVLTAVSGFDNDYACGKGVFMRHAVELAKLTNNAALLKLIFNSAQYAWNTAAIDAGLEHSIQFSWNLKGQLPPGSWDSSASVPNTSFRTMILQASGLNVLSAAALLNPNGLIPDSQMEPATAGASH